MKRNSILFFSLVVFFNCAVAEPIDGLVFEDNNLRACVNDTAATYGFADTDLLISLECSGRDIESLSGIEKLTALQSLGLSNNKITSLAGIESLHLLTNLYAGHNNIRSLEPLTNLSGLRTLSLISNDIRSVTALTAHKNLEILYLIGNGITDLLPLLSLDKLSVVSVEGNAISQEKIEQFSSEYVGNLISDLGRPDLVSLQFSSTTLDLSDGEKKTKLDFTLNDDTSSDWEAYLGAQKSNGGVMSCSADRLCRSQYEFSIPQAATLGRWDLSLKFKSDKTGREHSYSAAALEVLGFDSGVSVIGTGTADDKTSPAVQEFTMSESVIDVSDGPKTIVYTLSASDSSGIDRREIYMSVVGGGISSRTIVFPRGSNSVSYTFDNTTEPGYWFNNTLVLDGASIPAVTQASWPHYLNVINTNYAPDTDGDGTPDSIDLDDDGDYYTDTYEINNGFDPLDPASKPEKNVFFPQQDKQMSAYGYTEVEFPIELVGEDFDKILVEWINPVGAGFIVTGRLQKTNTDDLSQPLYAGQFIARLKPNGELDDSFGSRGFVLQADVGAAPTARSATAQLSNGSIIWAWGDGVVQKLTAQGLLDTAFKNSAWASAGDHNQSATLAAVYLPINSAFKRHWGMLEVDAMDKIKILSCRVAPASGQGEADCDLSWFMLNSDGSTDTAKAPDGIVDLGLNLIANVADPISGRLPNAVQYTVNTLRSGEKILTVRSWEAYADGHWPGIWSSRSSLYRLHENGLLNESVAPYHFNANRPQGSERNEWVNDIAEAEDGSIWVIDYRVNIDGSAEEMLTKLTADLKPDNTFNAGAGELLIQRLETSKLGVSRFSADSVIGTEFGVRLLVARYSFDNVTPSAAALHHYQVGGELVSVVDLPSAPLSYSASFQATEDFAPLYPHSGVVLGAGNSGRNFAFMHLGTIDTNGNGVAEINEASISESDFDNDGIPDAMDEDDDNDGISDTIENSYAFLNPLNATDAQLDFDGDGVSNLLELTLGTEIVNAASNPGIGYSAHSVAMNLDVMDGYQIDAYCVDAMDAVIDHNGDFVFGPNREHSCIERKVESLFTPNAFSTAFAQVEVEQECSPDAGDVYPCPIAVERDANYISMGSSVSLLDAGSVVFASWHELDNDAERELGLTNLVKKAYGATDADMTGEYRLSVLGREFDRDNAAESVWQDQMNIHFDGEGQCAVTESVALFDMSQGTGVGDSLNNRSRLEAEYRQHFIDSCSYVVEPSGMLHLTMSQSGEIDNVAFEISSDFQYLLSASIGSEAGELSREFVMATKLDSAPVFGDNREVTGSYFVASEVTGYWSWNDGVDDRGFDFDSLGRTVIEFTSGNTDTDGFSECKHKSADLMMLNGAGFDSNNNYYWGHDSVEGRGNKSQSCRYKVNANGEVEIRVDHSNDGSNVEMLTGWLGATGNSMMFSGHGASENHMAVITSTYAYQGMGVRIEAVDVAARAKEFLSLPGVKADPVKSDFNSDDTSDILWYHQASGWLSNWTMSGGAVESKALIATQYDRDWKVAAIADFDADGDSDVLWHHATQGWTNIQFMQDGEVVEKQPLGWTADTNWQIVGAGDLDADGDADIVWRNKAYGWTSVWILDGATVIEKKSVGTVSDLDWSIVAVEDFDGDSKADLLWHHASKGWSNIWTMDGANRIAKQPFAWVEDTNWLISAADDFDADGDKDLIWHHRLSGWTSLWTLSSLTIEDKTLIGTVVDTNWSIKASGDYDGDGDADLLWHHQLEGWSNIWLMEDAGFTKQPLTWQPDTNWQVQY